MTRHDTEEDPPWTLDPDLDDLWEGAHVMWYTDPVLETTTGARVEELPPIRDPENPDETLDDKILLRKPDERVARVTIDRIERLTDEGYLEGDDV